MKYTLNKLVEVEWRDACGRSSWQDISDYLDLAPIQCKTAGYVLNKTEHFITIASTQSITSDINGAISIPVPWVKKIRTLK